MPLPRPTTTKLLTKDSSAARATATCCARNLENLNDEIKRKTEELPRYRHANRARSQANVRDAETDLLLREIDDAQQEERRR